MQERYAPIRNGSVISAVDLIRGIGVCAGLTPVEVEGATGLYDTNYEGKAEAALRALRDEDFVFLHIEASDEAGHEGDAELKVRTIEALDARVVRPIFEAVSAWECPVSLAILPDHPTPCLLRTHTAAPVPSRSGGAAAIPTWWGPTTNRVPDGAATATCGAMPSSTSSSTVPNNGRKIQVSTR